MCAVGAAGNGAEVSTRGRCGFSQEWSLGDGVRGPFWGLGEERTLK